MRVFVGGQYMDEAYTTIGRDMKVADECAEYLWKKTGSLVTIVIDSYMGFGKRFADYWVQLGGEVMISHIPHFVHGLMCALYFQGNSDDVSQMMLFRRYSNIPIIAFTGSGCASGGKISVDEWHLTQSNGCNRAYICTENPHADAKCCAAALISEVLALINCKLPSHLK